MGLELEWFPTARKEAILWLSDMPFLDVLCECSKCRLVHPRSSRIKAQVEKEPPFLSILCCPRCGKYAYTVVGETPVRRKDKDA